MCLSALWAGMLIPSNYLRHFLVWGSVFGSGPLGRASLACLGCPCFGWPVPVRFSFGFLFLLLRGSSLSLLPLGVLLWLSSCCCLPLWLWCLRFGPLSLGSPPSPPPLVVSWCFLVQSVFCWSLPPDIWLYLQRSGCLTFGMACRGWLAPVFSPLPGNKGFGPVWGSALYTMLWVLFMCLSLRHWGIRPRVIQNTPRTPLKLHAPAFLACAAFSLLSCCLPGRLLFPSLMASACLLPPAPSFCWALSARLVVLCLGWCLWLLLLCGLGLSSWRGLFFVLLGLFGFVVLFVPGWFLFFVFSFWWLLLTPFWSGTLVLFAFTCTTQASIIIGLVCLSADWTGSLVLLTFTGLPCRCFCVIVWLFAEYWGD